jgi:potassium efflux system protein
MTSTPTQLLFALLLGFALLAPASGADTPPAGSGPTDLPYPSELKSAQAKLANDQSLDEAQKARAREMYDQASDWLQQAQQIEEARKRLELEVKNAPRQIETLRLQATRNKQQSDIAKFIAKADLSALELRISQDELELTLAREQQKQQLDTLAKLLVGSQQINEKINEHSRTLPQIEQEIDNLPAGEPKSLSQARILSLKSRYLQRQTELELNKLKLGNLSLLTDLAQARRDSTANLISRLQQDLEQLNTAASTLKQSQASEARQAAEALQEQASNLPQPLRVIARENATNRAELERLIRREKQLADQLEKARRQLDEIRTDFASTRRRVEVVGSSEAIGNMLYRRREALPSLSSYARSSAQRKEEINQATDRQITIEELLRERGNLRAVVEQTLGSLPQATEELSQDELRSLTEDLTLSRRQALNELQKVYSRYIALLTSLDLAERQLVEVSESYITFINDQLIWISSGSLTSFQAAAISLAWFFHPDKWIQLTSDALNAYQRQPALGVLVLLLIGLQIRYRKLAAERLPQLAESLRKIRTDTFPLTLWALYYSLVKIALSPLLTIGIGLQLMTLPTAAPFTAAFAQALVTVGISLSAVLLLFEVCRAQGLGPRHLRWRSSICNALNAELRWVIPTLVPLRFLTDLSVGSNLPAEIHINGRLAIIGLLTGASVFVYRLLKSQSAFMAGWKSGGRQSLLIQLHFLWFPLLLLIQGGMIVSTAVGYQTLALTLLEHLEVTFWFFVGLFFIKELLLRYLFVAERRLRYQNALRKRDELRAQRESEQQHADDESSAISVEIPELNFEALGEQAKRLVRFGYLFSAVVGLWMIWSDLLPALDFFNQITLPLSTTQVVDGISTEMPLSLKQLLIGLVVLVVTLLAAKNLPGVLEITLLQRLPLDSGARYALTTLLQYLIVGIGVISAFSTIGFQWSSIQWLVAALGVGLGFGLQEIVANFISGIILLFERPIRVGDVVTLDDTTGVVSRIQIRATTIINYDKQELLIPNKEFITGRVINWTLTDKINRVIINVGVAYGSDVNQAMALMLEAAQENQNVLEDPQPVATFEGFGDNTLNLLLRSYLGDMDNRLSTITALHQAINQKFNQAGINIAFPQRDLHLDTQRPLDIRIQRKPRNAEPE